MSQMRLLASHRSSHGDDVLHELVVITKGVGGGGGGAAYLSASN